MQSTLVKHGSVGVRPGTNRLFQVLLLALSFVAQQLQDDAMSETCRSIHIPSRGLQSTGLAVFSHCRDQFLMLCTMAHGEELRLDCRSRCFGDDPMAIHTRSDSLFLSSLCFDHITTAFRGHFPITVRRCEKRR